MSAPQKGWFGPSKVEKCLLNTDGFEAFRVCVIGDKMESMDEEVAAEVIEVTPPSEQYIIPTISSVNPNIGVSSNGSLAVNAFKTSNRRR